jgi:signal transduction histidine kinase
MKSGPWRWLKRLPALLTMPRREPVEHSQRIVALQRHIILPVRLVAVVAAFHQLYQKPWFPEPVTTYAVVFETFLRVFEAYAFFTMTMTVVFYVVHRFPPYLVQWMVFVMGLADGVFLGGLTVLTGGFESVLYWVYPAVIVLNAISIPLATPQIVLNLLISISFLLAGVMESSSPSELNLANLLHPRSSPKVTSTTITNLPAIAAWLRQAPDPLVKPLWDNFSESTRTNLSAYLATGTHEAETKTALADDLNRLLFPLRALKAEVADTERAEVIVGSYMLRIIVLVLLSFCCYGVQALAAGQQRAEEEQQEFNARTSQLHAAGRLAAEFAHQIKNPLTIINNVTFSLQKAFKSSQSSQSQASRQIEIIQEEVAKADRIITQIMGYAQLSEGRIEKLDVVQQLNHVCDEVFPAGVPTDIRLHRDYTRDFPPLLMQLRHFSETVANLLQNAREAVSGHGDIWISAQCLSDYSVEISVRDNGPGIAPDKLERIFEAYYTTKPRGSGLGLAVVKHNVELYGGTVRVESGLGNGAKFVLTFPAKTLLKLGK